MPVVSGPFDDEKAYGIINLYAGVRDHKGAWDVTLYFKNIANMQRVLSRGALPVSTSTLTSALPD